MRILITGATGFIGSELLPLLINKFTEAEILCCVRDGSHIRDIVRRYSVRVCVGIDEKVISDFAPEFVIHLAAYNTSNEEKGDIDALVESNIRLGLYLLRALRKTTSLKLFINTGSFSQYTSVGDAYLYSASKSAFEVFLNYYSKTYNWKYITVVPYSVYGGVKTVKRLIDYIIESVNAPVPVDMSPGEQQLDFIHVHDVVSFYISAIRNYQNFYNGEVYHLGTGTTYTIRQLVKIVQETLGQKCNINWGGLSYRRNDVMYSCAPLQPERDKIWRPIYDLPSGIKQYLSKEYI